MNKRSTVLLVLAAGVAIGLTWPRTKKYVTPLLNGVRKGVGAASGWLVGAGAAQKKRLGDLVAWLGAEKEKPTAKPKRARAKAAEA